MAKKLVQNQLNDLAAKVLTEVENESKDARNTINMKPHIYTIKLDSLVKEVSDQIAGENAIQDATRVSINSYREKKIALACKTYFNALKSSMRVKSKDFDTDIITETENEFSIRITARKPNASVYRNFIDTKRQGPLRNLKDSLTKGLLLEKDSSINSRINGYIKKDGTKVGGLLDIGHEEGSSIAEKRVQFLLEKLEAKAQTSKGKTKTVSPLFRILAEVRTNPRLENTKTVAFGADILVKEQGVDSNRRIQAGKEAALLNSVKKQIEALVADIDWANFSSSPSAMDIVENKILTTAKKAGAKISGKIKTIPKSTYKTSSDVKKQTIETTYQTDSGVSIKGRTKTVGGPKTQNWLQLLPIINAKLTPRVMANMRRPALVNRTGTFANSAKVVNIEQTREGFPSFVFDYERDPYDVFDRTKGRSPWNTPERDPRTLVDKSLREIVREMAIGRFYTRRA